MLGKFFGEYSNSWGHLIISIVALAFCASLLFAGTDVTTKGLAISVATLVIGYWFGTSMPKLEAVHTELKSTGAKTISVADASSPTIATAGTTTTTDNTTAGGSV